MKKFLLILLCLPLLFCSCSGDGREEESTLPVSPVSDGLTSHGFFPPSAFSDEAIAQWLSDCAASERTHCFLLWNSDGSGSGECLFLHTGVQNREIVSLSRDRSDGVLISLTLTLTEEPAGTEPMLCFFTYTGFSGIPDFEILSDGSYEGLISTRTDAPLSPSEG